MLRVRTEDAVGKVLAYDTTYVGPDKATVLLRRGHVITEEDVRRLKDSGVYYVWIEGGEEERATFTSGTSPLTWPRG